LHPAGFGVYDEDVSRVSSAVPMHVLLLIALVGVAWALLPKGQAWVATALCAVTLWLLLHPAAAVRVLPAPDLRILGVVRYLRGRIGPWLWSAAREIPY
jgi:hypothetical protein